eukprot:COSAG06_NODE_38718_length_420_cov_1.118380_1_plen_30_part_01
MRRSGSGGNASASGGEVKMRAQISLGLRAL